MSGTPLTRFIRRLSPTLRGGISDTELLHRWAETRDEAAFEVLVWRHGPMVLATCRGLLTESDAEDAFQATFLALVRKAPTIRNGESIAGWLHRVAHRIALRARMRRGPTPATGSLPEPAAPPDDIHLWRDLRPLIDEEVNRLPQRYREPFVLCCLEGKTNEEAARELGRPLGTILSRLSWARQRLRVRLARRGVVPAAVLVALSGEVSAAVPRSLVDATLHCVAGGASATIRALAAGAGGGAAMLFQIRAAVAAVVAIGTLTAGVALCGADTPGQPQKPPEKPIAAKPDTEPGIPKGWTRGTINFDAYEVGIDHHIVKEGKSSAYLRLKEAENNSFAALSQTIPAGKLSGKQLRLTGQVRTAGVEGASLWMRIDGSGQTLKLENMDGKRLRGDQDWTKLEIALDVPDGADAVTFGLLVVGKGQAWLDDVTLEPVGDAVNLGFEDGVTPVFKPRPLTRQEADWFKRTAIAFETDEPGRGFTDLQAFKEIVGDARIVSLGEATHGTREFFRMKHRLTEYLATEAGFTYFAIEANLPEARRVNDYVLGGEGDPRELLKGMYFWTWNTQEVLDMIEWMRKFNASGKGRIQFLGFDMQTGSVAAANVKEFVARVDPDFKEELEKAYDGLTDYWADPAIATVARRRPRAEKEAIARRAWDVLKRLEASRDAYVKKVPAEKVEHVIQDARVAAQAAELQVRGGAYRDECMADNVAHFLEAAPRGSKIVLWAHNGHIARINGAMGSHLAKRYGREVVTVGFTCASGTYTAVRRGVGLSSENEIQPPPEGSVEYTLQQTGHPRCMIDLRKATKEPAGQWLAGQLRFRMVGALAMEQQFALAVLPEQFDALIYFEKTTASKCFGFTRS